MVTVGAAGAGAGAMVVEVEVVGVVAVAGAMVEITRGNVHGKTNTRQAGLIIIERQGTIRKWRERALVLPAEVIYVIT